MNQVIQIPCKECHLHLTCQTVGMNSFGSDEAPLKIFVDCPSKEDDQRHVWGKSRQAEFLKWLCKRISLKEEDYQVSFTLKCHIPKKVLTKKIDKLECIEACTPFRLASLQNAKAILTMGELSCLAFTGMELKKRVNCDWKSVETPARIFTTYAVGYALEKPAETVGISRMLWYASANAGLRPAVDSSVPQFDYEVL